MTIPDELAVAQADGTLLIYVDLPTGLKGERRCGTW